MYIYGLGWLQAVIEKTNVDPSEVGDIVVGTVLAPGSQRASECRMAAFYAGFPGLCLSLNSCIFFFGISFFFYFMCAGFIVKIFMILYVVQKLCLLEL